MKKTFSHYYIMSTPTYRFWHGGHRFESPIEIRPSKKGEHEYGPGFYLTTRLQTASKYAKGGGNLVLVETKAPLTWLEEVSKPVEEVHHFLKSTRIRRRESLMDDIKTSLERLGGSDLPLSYLVNLMFYHDAIAGQAGVELASFLVGQGVDASLVHRHQEDWVVLMNPKVVLSARKIKSSEIDWKEQENLGTVGEQNWPERLIKPNLKADFSI